MLSCIYYVIESVSGFPTSKDRGVCYALLEINSNNNQFHTIDFGIRLPLAVWLLESFMSTVDLLDRATWSFDFVAP